MKRWMNVAEIKVAPPGTYLWDHSVPGLHLRVHPARKSFYLYFRTKTGIERRPKLGDFGVITLLQAREIARDMLAQVAAGRDPVAERKAIKASPTVAEFCDRYEQDYLSRKKSQRPVKWMIENIVKPKLGAKRMCDVTEDDCHALHDSLFETPTQANRVRALLSKMFNLAETQRWGALRPRGTNPTFGVAPYPERDRKRFVRAEEFPEIGKALQKYADRYPEGVAFLYVLLYSGARPSEIETAKREWLQGSVLRLPDAKTGSRDIYLPPQALQAIADLPVQPDGRIFGIKFPRHVWRKVQTDANCPDLWGRDLRRSFATVGMAAGVPDAQTMALLGHKSAQTHLIYKRLMEETGKAAAELTASRIESFLKVVRDKDGHDVSE